MLRQIYAPLKFADLSSRIKDTSRVDLLVKETAEVPYSSEHEAGLEPAAQAVPDRQQGKPGHPQQNHGIV